MVCIHSFLQFIFFFFLICQQIPSEVRHLRLQSGVDASQVGTRWAVLVAGSSGFQNYRHQADVCHAYQTLKKGGLKDENIIVFMYDDIANNEENPMPGVIINHPQGENVYRGVPKDYVGEDVNAGNFLAVLLGNKTALTRQGSGKVVDSGPGDHIFVFYSGHGGPGILDMPAGPSLLANDLIDALKEKHAYGTYKSMVLYIEACEAGSIFEGLLPKGLNIYATTASNTIESSWATYCAGDYTAFKGFHPCLGDLYSVSWMEDSDVHNLRTETVNQQYNLVKVRTAVNNTYKDGSHVMQYGDVDLSTEHLYSFIGSNPANDNRVFIGVNAISSFSRAINQRDVDLLYFWNKYLHSADGSLDQREAQRRLFDAMAYRLHIDDSVELIGNLLFGAKRGIETLMATRSAGQPLVDDWICLKSMVRIFETHCGSLSQYGMKHMRAIANICNAGIKGEIMAKVSAQACPSIPSSRWSSLRRGFSV